MSLKSCLVQEFKIFVNKIRVVIKRNSFQCKRWRSSLKNHCELLKTFPVICSVVVLYFYSLCNLFGWANTVSLAKGTGILEKRKAIS